MKAPRIDLIIILFNIFCSQNLTYRSHQTSVFLILIKELGKLGLRPGPFMIHLKPRTFIAASTPSLCMLNARLVSKFGQFAVSCCYSTIMLLMSCWKAWTSHNLGSYKSLKKKKTEGLKPTLENQDWTLAWLATRANHQLQMWTKQQQNATA